MLKSFVGLMASAVVISISCYQLESLMVCRTIDVPLLRNRTFVMKSASGKLGEIPKKTCQTPPPPNQRFIHLTASVMESGAVNKWPLSYWCRGAFAKRGSSGFAGGGIITVEVDAQLRNDDR